MMTRFSAEVATAIGTAALGLTAVIGAWEFGIGWGAAGPEPGAFPFYIGLLIIIGSAGTLAQTIRHRHGLPGQGLQAIFLDKAQAARVASFFVPMALFVIVALLLGLYVAAALYLTLVMWLQGGYRPAISALTGIAASVFFYVVLEHAFQVPLLKGPLESALGLY
jgi:hypothetical protein